MKENRTLEDCIVGCDVCDLPYYKHEVSEYFVASEGLLICSPCMKHFLAESPQSVVSKKFDKPVGVSLELPSSLILGRMLEKHLGEKFLFPVKVRFSDGQFDYPRPPAVMVEVPNRNIRLAYRPLKSTGRISEAFLDYYNAFCPELEIRLKEKDNGRD